MPLPVPDAMKAATLARPIPLPVATAKAERPPKRQWVHLLPLGRLRGRDGRAWTLPPSKARQFVQRSSRANADRLVIDYEHQTDLAAENGGKAPAAGWIVELAVRPDGVWGLAEWTARAASMIASREYRFLSPIFTRRWARRCGWSAPRSPTTPT